MTDKSRHRILDWQIKRYKITRPFTIARGTKNTAEQIIVTLKQGDHIGHGACVPYRHNGETLESVAQQIETLRGDIENGLSIEDLQPRLPAGSARNALDCALWDLKSRELGQPIWKLANIDAPTPRITATTLSVTSPAEVGEQAQQLSAAPLLKLKLAGDDIDIMRIEAAIKNAPNAKYILDANESLTRKKLDALISNLDLDAISLIEQPVAAGRDEELSDFKEKHILCADESFHLAEDTAYLSKFYGAVNIKLDKTGGFTGALEAVKTAQRHNMTIMLGCMLGSSLAMAPAFLLAPFAQILDLDGPILLAQDDENGFTFDGSLMNPASLWGHP